ncbi:MAG: DUF1848 domain-containing protein [Erysipelotrichia bacterium]|nr:DUF1848 domain-containing protein [Erysipelotrichia bacterium]
MIINVSGRCDICAFFSEWLMKRIRAGFVDVRNPFYPNQISRIILDKTHVDAIFFCTKNPLPMLPYLDELDQFHYVFHVSLTPYRKDIEPNVVDKRKIMEAIKQLSKHIGAHRVVVRYDPILVNDVYSISYHIKMFQRLCEQLTTYVNVIVISFLDMKKNTIKNAQHYGLRTLEDEEITVLAKAFGEIAKNYHMQIQTCAEEVDLTKYGINKQACISNELMYQLTGKMKRCPKSKARKECECIQSVDIGQYNCCSHFCRYCYANYDEKQVQKNMHLHDPNATMLIGHLEENDQIKIREK